MKSYTTIIDHDTNWYTVSTFRLAFVNIPGSFHRFTYNSELLYCSPPCLPVARLQLYINPKQVRKSL